MSRYASISPARPIDASLDLILLGVIVIGGAAVRLNNLTERGMGHTEIYVPNIELPSDYGNPRSRTTLVRTITNSSWEPHPAGWYIAMFAWTKAAGTSLTAIRLPGVVFGVLCVLLVFLLAKREFDPVTGLIAAGLIALNGHQVVWAQIARPATLVAAEGLLSALILLRLIDKPTVLTAITYGVVCVVGMTSEYYFWLLFGGQIVYVLIRVAIDGPGVLSVARWQVVMLVAGAPLLTVAAFQGGADYLSSTPLYIVRALLGFGFLFERTSLPVQTALGYGLAILGAALLAFGVAGEKHGAKVKSQARMILPDVPTWIVMLLAAGAVGLSIAAAHYLGGNRPARQTAMLATAVIPVMLFVAHTVLHRFGPATADILRRWMVKMRITSLDPSLTTVVAIVPFATVLALGTFKPLLASRHVLVMVPFFLILMSYGVTRLRAGSLTTALRVLIVVALVALGWMSIPYHQDRHEPREDYRGLAALWAPQVAPGDLLLVPDVFRTVPIFYYMPPSRFSFVGLRHVEVVRKRNPPRIWAYLPSGPALQPSIQQALSGYKRVSQIETLRNVVYLYVRE